MVEVRIRAGDAKSVHLGEVPFTAGGLNEALRLVRAWGLVTGDVPDHPDSIGQFVLDNTGAYFEIVALAKEDE